MFVTRWGAHFLDKWPDRKVLGNSSYYSHVECRGRWREARAFNFLGLFLLEDCTLKGELNGTPKW